MKTVFLTLLWPLAVAAGLSSLCRQASAEPPQTTKLLLSNCSIDNEISVANRNAIDQAATKFVQDLTGANPAGAYAAMTPEAKKKMTAEKFTVMAHERIQSAGPFKNLHVAHTYFVKIASKGTQQQVACGDTTKPEQWANVAAKAIPRQAHAIVEGQTASGSRAFTLWLIPEQKSWHVQDFQLGVESLAGKQAHDLWDLARAEEQQNHDFNAYMLYVTALQLAWRGPNLELGVHAEIQKEMQAAQKPKDLKEQAGFNWESDNSAFKVVSMGPIASDGKMYLQISQELPPWTEDKDADSRNRALAGAFAKLYPEYRDVFAGLAVEAHGHGTTLKYRTLIPN